MFSDSTDLNAFSTPRLRAERLCSDHLEFLCSLHEDPRVMATLGGPKSPEATQAQMRRNLQHWQRHGFGLWIFRDGATGECVGRAGLRSVDIEGTRETEVAYAVAADHWGRGLATEMAAELVEIAFQRLGLSRIVSFTLPTNTASRRVMEKVGLTFECNIVHANLPHVLYSLTSKQQCDT